MKYLTLFATLIAGISSAYPAPKVYRGIGNTNDFKTEGAEKTSSDIETKKATPAHESEPHVYVAPAREIVTARDFGAGAEHYLETKSGWQTIARIKIPDVTPGEVWDIVAGMSIRNFGARIAFVPRVVVSSSPCTLNLELSKEEHLVIHVGAVYIPENSRRFTQNWHDHWEVPPELSGNVFVELQVIFLSVPEKTERQGQKIFFRRLSQQFVSIIRHQ